MIISMSGGLASAAAAFIAAKQGTDFHMFFADTKIEDDDLHRFLYDVEQYLNKPIIRLSDGRDPWDVFVDVSQIGSSRAASCSKVLKTQQIKKFCDAVFPADTPIILGMYPDEAERLQRAQQNWNPRPVRSLLIEQRVYPGDVEKMICVDAGIKKPRLYEMGFPHNNCGGMCVRAGQGQFARLLEMRPAFYARQEQRNEWARKQIIAQTIDRMKRGVYKGKADNPFDAAGGFIRVTRNGETEYLHMKEFRERVQSGQLKPARYEMGGCGCFVDDV